MLLPTSSPYAPVSSLESHISLTYMHNVQATKPTSLHLSFASIIYDIYDVSKSTYQGDDHHAA